MAAVSLAAEAAPEGAAPMTITSACVLSVHDSIGVGYWEAWEAFDPEAAKAAREDIRRADLDLPQLPYDPLQDRNRWHPEVRNVVYAGWDAVVAWLRVLSPPHPDMPSVLNGGADGVSGLSR